MKFFKNFKARRYQETIFASCVTNNTLVVLPTGLGKTAISMMLVAARLNKYPDSKAVILAPTKPLVNQHRESFVNFFDISFMHPDEMVVMTGAVKAEKRKVLWDESRVIFSTPQGLENDVLSGRISLSDVSLMVFDEAHRATGDYSYVWLAKQYRKQAKNERILSLTASPGTDQEVIDEVCKNMFVEKVEFRDRNSADVKEYVKEVKFKWHEVELPLEFKVILDRFNSLYKDGLKKVEAVFGKSNKKNMSKRELLGLQAKLQGLIASGEGASETYSAISDIASMLKVQHAIELLETQGINPCLKYVETLFKQGNMKKSKAAMRLAADPKFKEALTKLWKLRDNDYIHPKIPVMLDIVRATFAENSDAKIIIFNNYRDSIKNLHGLIEKEFVELDVKGNKVVRPAIFIGQSKKNGLGLSQKEQLAMISDFKSGKHNVMIMSSVGEEGLDIPAVDLVLFYEPVPSAIRQIQRAGRTGRQDTGKVVILMAKGTRDVAYRWSTKAKEARMYDILTKAKSHLTLKDSSGVKYNSSSQKTLVDDYSKDLEEEEEEVVDNKLRVIVDSREKSNRIIKDLLDFDCSIDLKRLDIGDYILTDEVAVEFKTNKDFVDSIVDGRLLEQCAVLSRTYGKPIIVVQGESDIYSIRNISPNAILGAISAISVNFRIPIIFTRNNSETVSLFMSIIKKQKKIFAGFNPHTTKPKGDRELQEYIVGSLPDVGPTLARSLLEKTGSVRGVFDLNEEDLLKVDKIGKGKASKISSLLDKKYN